MTPDMLRYRITPEWKESRAQDAFADAEVERLWEQGLSTIQYYDDLDERHLAQGQSVRSAHNAQRRGVERLFRLMCHVHVQARPDFFTPVEPPLELAEWLYDVSWGPYIHDHFDRLMPNLPERETRVAGNRKDVKDNFLYEEWKEQAKRKGGIKTYPLYALYVSVKAAITLMTTKPGAFGMIGGCFFDHEREVALREAVIKFKESKEYVPHDPAQLIGYALLIPDLINVAETLMMQYSDFVRAERGALDKLNQAVVDSYLPDDPHEGSLPDRYLLPDDVRFENAYQAYLAKEGSARKIANRYALPEKKFFAYLKERGAMNPRGGDRKA